jgi:hypothetical protein
MIKGNIGERLYQAEMPPPPGAWDNIALLLGDEDAEKTIAPLIPITSRKKNGWMRIALAASLIAFVAATALWLAEKNNKSAASVATKDQPQPQPKPDSVIIRDTVFMPGEKIMLPPSKIYVYPPANGNPVTARNNPAGQNNTRGSRPGGDNPLTGSPPGNDNGNRQLQVRTNPNDVAGNNPKLGTAQMVDSNGQVIRNISAVNATSSNNATGPESKGDKSITNILSRISQAGDGEELDSIINNSPYWKQRVLQWRQKLIKSGFTPSIINHLDIVELQKLLKEDK